ncbi:MAG TPA: F0F1 ATP synthase subunit delta [Candidatus Thiothrix moscowensis]|uniref:F0F1 ATP synthase subunit delta n=1 Tax=unclassified Thiothrix TaxID=2636184 RepID=UPI001A2044E5|nr:MULTISPECIES: F0F1 ATP synthase subunit delta [unclassified Thiothrix]MBJ6609529.1 F0F1 ATP synthase subunit delta [Candidatus Thiothrix moscowensis]HRJ51465.1 F0F1 ATP synthase subunit delta [Candidatus Thiothrix moscowensis]HRJ91480.1 F0F1 ATP synthase subunit delta [Candidatus Thiothrix moscowensis]
MSELTTAARPYARAVFEMAQEAGKLPQWSAQLAAMSAVVAAEGSASLLAHPRMSKEQKADIFAEIAGDALDDQGRNLLKTLAENDRFALLPEMATIFEQLRAEAEGAIEAEIVSAQEMSDDQQQKIAAALQKRLGREIKLVTKVDPTLMGGAIVRAGDLVIDGSIHSRLKDMKAALAR